MRTLLAALALLLASAAPAQTTSPPPLTLARALALGPEASAAVLSSRSQLAAAQRDEARVKADPAALRVDRITAETARLNAERSLEAALAANRVTVANAFVAALEADTALAVAHLDASMQQQTLAAQRARLDAGAATDLDVAKARNVSASAQASVADATTQRTLAYTTLASLIGAPVTALNDRVTLPELGSLDDYLQRARRGNAALAAARGSQGLARAQLEAADNDFSSAAQIQDARDSVADAARQLAETERTLELSVRGAYANAMAARAAVQNASSTDAAAQQDLDAARAQLDAGSISPLAFRSSQLTREQAAQALAAARHALVVRIYTLEQAVAGG